MFHVHQRKSRRPFGSLRATGQTNTSKRNNHGFQFFSQDNETALPLEGWRAATGWVGNLCDQPIKSL